MGRSEPGGEKERELARMTTMVIAAGRREGRQANDWRTFNEKTIKQAKTGLFIQNLCETEHPGDYERAGIFILESRRDLGRLYEMASVTIVIPFSQVSADSFPVNIQECSPSLYAFIAFRPTCFARRLVMRNIHAAREVTLSRF